MAPFCSARARAGAVTREQGEVCVWVMTITMGVETGWQNYFRGLYSLRSENRRKKLKPSKRVRWSLTPL